MLNDIQIITFCIFFYFKDYDYYDDEEYNDDYKDDDTTEDYDNYQDGGVSIQTLNPGAGATGGLGSVPLANQRGETTGSKGTTVCDWTPVRNSIRGFPSFTWNLMNQLRNGGSNGRGNNIKSNSMVSGGRGGPSRGNNNMNSGSRGNSGWGNPMSSGGWGGGSSSGWGGNNRFGSSGWGNSFGNSFGRMSKSNGGGFWGNQGRFGSSSNSNNRNSGRSGAMSSPIKSPSGCGKCGFSQPSFSRTSIWNSMRQK